MGQREHRYSVYILGSIGGTLYVGMTNDLVARVRQHQKHTFGGFTERYEVTRLLYYERFGDVGLAIRREKQLKGWRREKKIALIEGFNPQWRDLSREWDQMRLTTLSGPMASPYSGPSTTCPPDPQKSGSENRGGHSAQDDKHKIHKI